MLEKRSFYIDGRWVAPALARDCEVVNPSDETPCAVISLGAKDDVDRAVAAARAAFWLERNAAVGARGFARKTRRYL